MEDQMNAVESTGRRRARRGRMAIATLASAAAIFGGGQALMPATATAMKPECERLLSAAERYYWLFGKNNALHQYYWNRFVACAATE
jgi:hypothetical protein